MWIKTKDSLINTDHVISISVIGNSSGRFELMASLAPYYKSDQTFYRLIMGGTEEQCTEALNAIEKGLSAGIFIIHIANATLSHAAFQATQAGHRY